MSSQFTETLSFIRKIYDKADGVIPLHEPYFNEEEKELVMQCLDSSFVSSAGKFTSDFEDEISKLTSSPYSVATVNGTSALQLALQLAGVKKGELVITQALSFIATANAIGYLGAEPLFLDIRESDLCLSPQSVSAFIDAHCEVKNGSTFFKKDGRRITACVPVHLFGQTAEVEELKEICHKAGIKVVEDAAQAIGSFRNEKHAGTIGDFGIISFNGNKTITCGGGGAILCKDKESFELGKHLSTQAKIRHPWRFSHDYTGYNFRLPAINAALGLAQLKKLQPIIENKKQIAKLYSEFFSASAFKFIEEYKETKSNFWLNTIILESEKERDSFLEESNAAGIHCRPAWDLIADMEMYKGCYSDDLSVSRDLGNRLINLPSSYRK